jgi:deoxycytidylate deaminase
MMTIKEALELSKKGSSDPITQVGCVIFRKDTGAIVSFGANKVLEAFRKISDEIVSTPLHPLKKLVMMHAEESALFHLPYSNRANFVAVCSLQPCMNCVRQLAGVVEEIYWVEDNRHQADQELMAPLIDKVFRAYRKLEREDDFVVHW